MFIQHTQCLFLPQLYYLYYIQRKIFFRWTFFLYSPCPNLEGIKDALPYKFRRLTIGQNYCTVCTNEGVMAQGPQKRILERTAQSGAFRETCSAGHQTSSEARGEVCSLSQSGGRFDKRECHHLIHGEFKQLLLACSEGCGLHHSSIGSKFGATFICTCPLYQLAIEYRACCQQLMHISHIIP